ncbi:MAG: hypothetical protein ACFFBD_10975 [Candidatus Hodarchaeota archaeon]
MVLENTGVYSEPVITALKAHFRLHVINAADTKRANREKTDSEDAW